MALELLLLLLGHAIGETVLQPRWIRFNKHRADSPRWIIGLGLHGLIHGAFVAVITGSLLLGLGEIIAHSLIDFGKGEGWYQAVPDQLMHASCKLAWVLL